MSGRGQKVHRGSGSQPPRRGAGGPKRGGKRGPRIDAATLAHLDEDEARLEALVFGGGAGTSLGGSHHDAGSSARVSASHEPSGARSRDGAAKAARAAAWDDEDDAGIAVDIASTARLRKLRAAEGEVAIAGDEYGRRLRERHAALVAGSGAVAAAAGPGAAAPGSWAALPAVKRKRPAGASVVARGGDEDSDSGAAGGAGAGAARASGRRRLDSDDQEDGDDDGAAAGYGAAAFDDSDGDEDDEDEGTLLRSAGGVVAGAAGDGEGGRGGPLAGGHLSISRVRDANRAEPSKAVIQAAAFHHSAGAVLMTGGLDRKLRFFAIDGKRNPKVASVMFPDLPIASAGWSHDGNEVFVSGRRPFFYSYDVAGGAATRIPRLIGRDEKSLESMVVQTPTSCMTAAGGAGGVGAAAAFDVPLLAFLGNDGTVILASQHTKTLVTTLRLNGSVRAATFVKPWLSPADSHTGWSDLLTIGSEGAVYRWDLRTMRCLYRHADEGSTGGTAIAGSEDGRYVAVGSTAGIVNVYDSSAHDIAKLYSLGTSSSSGAGAGAGAVAGASSVDALAGAGVFSAESLGGRAPRPLFSAMNLTTSISGLSFSPGAGEMLSIASQRTTDAFRLVHSASGKAFPNWPSNKTPLHYVTASSFSPHCGYIAVGNDRGRVLLYRLNHYAEA